MELEVERTAGHLRVDHRALALQRRAALQDGAVTAGPEHAGEQRGPRHRPPASPRNRLELVEEQAGTERRLDDAAAEPGELARDGLDLGELGRSARYRPPLEADVRR